MPETRECDPAPATAAAIAAETTLVQDRLVLGYWDIRGLGQPARNLLHYVGADFEEHLLTKMPDWLVLKTVTLPALGCSFPNLPFLIIPPGEDLDGSNTKPLVVTQSVAVMRWLGRKFGLSLKDPADQVRLDVIEQQVHDLRMGHLILSYWQFDTPAKPM